MSKQVPNNEKRYPDPNQDENRDSDKKTKTLQIRHSEPCNTGGREWNPCVMVISWPVRGTSFGLHNISSEYSVHCTIGGRAILKK